MSLYMLINLYYLFFAWYLIGSTKFWLFQTCVYFIWCLLLRIFRTIFEVDIDTFEEKPWRYQGFDITDYFNFGLNEESWKDYCKQLVIIHCELYPYFSEWRTKRNIFSIQDQHRIETTMQSRIRVYESGRTDQVKLILAYIVTLESWLFFAGRQYFVNIIYKRVTLRS